MLRSVWKAEVGFSSPAPPPNLQNLTEEMLCSVPLLTVGTEQRNTTYAGVLPLILRKS